MQFSSVEWAYTTLWHCIEITPVPTDGNRHELEIEIVTGFLWEQDPRRQEWIDCHAFVPEDLFGQDRQRTEEPLVDEHLTLYARYTGTRRRDQWNVEVSVLELEDVGPWYFEKRLVDTMQVPWAVVTQVLVNHLYRIYSHFDDDEKVQDIARAIQTLPPLAVLREPVVPWQPHPPLEMNIVKFFYVIAPWYVHVTGTLHVMHNLETREMKRAILPYPFNQVEDILQLRVFDRDLYMVQVLSNGIAFSRLVHIAAVLQAAVAGRNMANLWNSHMVPYPHLATARKVTIASWDVNEHHMVVMLTYYNPQRGNRRLIVIDDNITWDQALLPVEAMAWEQSSITGDVLLWGHRLLVRSPAQDGIDVYDIQAPQLVYRQTWLDRPRWPPFRSLQFIEFLCRTQIGQAPTGRPMAWGFPPVPLDELPDFKALDGWEMCQPWLQMDRTDDTQEDLLNMARTFHALEYRQEGPLRHRRQEEDLPRSHRDLLRLTMQFVRPESRCMGEIQSRVEIVNDYVSPMAGLLLDPLRQWLLAVHGATRLGVDPTNGRYRPRIIVTLQIFSLLPECRLVRSEELWQSNWLDHWILDEPVLQMTRYDDNSFFWVARGMETWERWQFNGVKQYADPQDTPSKRARVQ